MIMIARYVVLLDCRSGQPQSLQTIWVAAACSVLISLLGSLMPLAWASSAMGRSSRV